MAVGTEWRRRGIASHLIAAVEDLCCLAGEFTDVRDGHFHLVLGVKVPDMPSGHVRSWVCSLFGLLNAQIAGFCCPDVLLSAVVCG